MLHSSARPRRMLALSAAEPDPYSGAVIASVLDVLNDFDTTSGSIHYSAQHQLPEAVVRRIVQARRAEIDAKAR